MTTTNSTEGLQTALGVSQVLKDSVTAVCPECQSSFETVLFKTGRQQKTFCSDGCRQSAYRKSPAHRKVLDGFKNQRFNRRMAHIKRANAFKYLSFDGRHSGPAAVGVPPLGALDLERFSKELSK
jgi:hypothetical protein